MRYYLVLQFPHRITPFAITPLAEQGQRIFFNQLLHGGEQPLEWNGLNHGVVDLHTAGIISQAFINFSKAGRVAGEAGAFDDAILHDRPAEELSAPGKSFCVMNAGVHRMIHVDQDHPAIVFSQRTDGSQGLMQCLRDENVIEADSAE